MTTVVVIGGGPAGMMAAVQAAKEHNVILIEKNDKLGKKLFISGKGRCNVTNAADINDFFENIPGNPKFLYSALYEFTNKNTMSFFENEGVNLKIERGNRVFPKSDKSSDIINAFECKLQKSNVHIKFNLAVVKFIVKDNNIICVETQDGNKIYGDYFILCTGGLSYPATGSTGDGFKFAELMGHNIIKPFPSLVPIEIKEKWVKNLQGLSLKNVTLTIVNEKNKVLSSEFGEMLFTHFGISGPIVLSMSRVINGKKNLKALIDLKPALDENTLDARIQRDFVKYSNKDFKNSLNELLPEKIIGTVVNLLGIDENKKVNVVTRDERKKLVHLLKHFTLSIKGPRSINEAIVTAGGVNIKEINSSTMKSKIINNLYFAGEVMDVDGYTGGFNIQIALSTGYLAGNSIGK